MFRANVTVGDTNVNRPKKLKQHIQKLKKKGGAHKIKFSVISCLFISLQFIILEK